MEISAVPKVSVIIPLYNKAPYIKRAIDSVLSQTVQDFEIVIVGGNSIDGGEEIVLQYSDPRIRFVKEQGKGVSAARNQGVGETKSDLLAFLDADDEWLPDFLDTILRLRKLYPNAGMYGTGFKVIHEDYVTEITTNDTTDTLIEDYYGYLCRYNHIIICPSSSMIPKNIYYNFGQFDPDIRWGEDRDFYCRIALFNPIAYSPNIHVSVYAETEHNSEAVTSNMDSKFAYRVVMRGNCIIKNKNYQNIQEYVDRLQMMIAGNYIARTGARKKALKYMRMVKNKLRVKWFFLMIRILLPRRVFGILLTLGKASPFYSKAKEILD